MVESEWFVNRTRALDYDGIELGLFNRASPTATLHGFALEVSIRGVGGGGG
jgi:hypothetical protein